MKGVFYVVHMQYKGFKGLIAKTVAAGLLTTLYLGWTLQLVFAAPVITNMPHRADGSRITGSQPVPKTMPGDVVVKTKPQSTGASNVPAADKPPAQAAPKTETPKPVTPPAQAAPITETPKPVTPPAQTAPAQTAPKEEAQKPVTLTTQAAQNTETPKPVTPPAQTAPKVEAQKPVTPTTQAAQNTEVPKPLTPTAQTPKPEVKTTPGTLPTKPPGLEAKRPVQSKTASSVKKEESGKPVKPESEKSVYQVGDKGWKIKQAQQYLQKLGFEPGETDGQFTKATRRAIRKFQKKYNLKETGNLDNATYNELKWQAEAKEYGGDVASTKILKTAAQYKGVPYVFGGTTPRGFDCSGYVQFVFAKHGIRLTRTADTQAKEGKFVSKKNLKPGDLVFFTTYEPGASHVGIYAGNQKFWNATSSRGIMLSDLNDSYWGPRYYTGRRILTGNDRSR